MQEDTSKEHTKILQTEETKLTKQVRAKTSELKQYLTRRVKEFEGGALCHFQSQWEELTSDEEVLQSITGLRIEVQDLPKHGNGSFPQNSKTEQFITGEVEKLLSKQVIERTSHEKGEFISPTFVTEKSDGGYRFILNLKLLNKEIDKKRFKMQTLSSILCLVRPNAYMAKLDIKDAYYSVPIHPESRKLLKFYFKDELFQFKALPNGYTEGPRKFTKIMKPPLSKLRREGIVIADYIDDLFNTAKTYEACMENIDRIVELLDSLGFIIHPEKSRFEPSQVMEFLGFIINTREMSLRLTPEKERAIQKLCTEVLAMQKVPIRTLFKILGKFSSSFMAIPFGRLHYRALERLKTEALKRNKGNLDWKISLSEEARQDIMWWKNNIVGSWSPISRGNPKLEMTSDASKIGWGAVFESSTGGHFTEDEKELHINILELKAVEFGLQSLCLDTQNTHILLKIDNTSAVSAINKMGSTRSIQMDDIVHSIWNWARERESWLTATHIPGIQNIEADKESRKSETRTEWMLDKDTFNRVLSDLDFQPTVDLFASRINCQIPRFFSFRPDPDCIGVNAFTVDWGELSFYAFPPFSCIPKVIQKIYHDKATGILVVPDWPNQPWYSTFLDMIIKRVNLSPRKQLLRLPQQTAPHPLHKHLGLVAAIVSGNTL